MRIDNIHIQPYTSFVRSLVGRYAKVLQFVGAFRGARCSGKTDRLTTGQGFCFHLFHVARLWLIAVHEKQRRWAVISGKVIYHELSCRTPVVGRCWHFTGTTNTKKWPGWVGIRELLHTSW